MNGHLAQRARRARHSEPLAISYQCTSSMASGLSKETVAMAATRAEEAETSFGDRGTATTASGLDGDQKIAETDIVRALDPIRRSLWSGFRLHIEVGLSLGNCKVGAWCVSRVIIQAGLYYRRSAFFLGQPWHDRHTVTSAQHCGGHCITVTDKSLIKEHCQAQAKTA